MSDTTNKNESLRKNVKPLSIEKELKVSFLDYAMSVIVSRALPDIRDGLKPVHRRILYAMHKLGYYHDKAYRKSATVVGEVIGHYHPHGDSPIYQSMVGLVQDFSKRYPLLDGQGNWGSIDGDNAAAMRYCITGDSLILTDKGMLPIKMLSNKKESRINLEIISYDGKKNKATKAFNSGKHKTFTITTKQGYTISGSHNHPLLCWGPNEFGCPVIQWKLLEDITTDDHVVLARKQNLFAKENPSLKQFHVTKKQQKSITQPKEMTTSLAFLLGALTAEESFHQTQILFCNKDKQFYNKCKNAFIKNFPEISFYERDIKGDCKEFAVYQQNVVQFLHNIGFENKRSANKEIPFTILQSKKAIVKAFLQALFEGNGSVSCKQDKHHNGKSIELTYNSKSKALIDQLKVVLLNFGIVTTTPYKDTRNQCYKLILSGVENIQLFYKEIGFFSKRKQEQLKTIAKLNKTRMSKTDFIPHLAKYIRENYSSSKLKRLNFDRYNKLAENHSTLQSLLQKHDLKLISWLKKQHYFFNKVESKTTSSPKEVFSVRVDSSCHSYVANGFINHNTECRLAKVAKDILADIEKDTVHFVPNFDESRKEPTLLPTKVPNFLINGSTGIAVGMATSVPPHNLTEVITACIELIKNPNLSEEQLFKIIPAPDFPTGGIICGRSGIVKAYRTGHGSTTVRAVVDIKEDKKQTLLIITEIPYQVNKADLITKIANLVKNKVIDGISNIRDESNKQGIRVVIDIKRGEIPQVVLNQLYKHTPLQTKISILMLALYQNRPMIFTLREVIEHFIVHRKEIITRRTEFDLAKNEARAHICKGLIIALDNIDKIVELIKKSESAASAIETLKSIFKLTDQQSKAILEMRLQRLTALEQTKLHDELKSLQEVITELRLILSEPEVLNKEIIKEFEHIKNNYGDKRKSRIEGAIDILEEKDLIPDEETVVTLTRKGYIKRVDLDTYTVQHRGGRGKKGIADLTESEDIMQDVFVAKTHDELLFFTNLGRVYNLDVFQVPEGSRTAKGRAIVNLLPLAENEKVVKLLCLREMENKFLVMVTKKGIIKKTDMTAFSKIRSTGIRALGLKDDDELAFCDVSTGSDTVVLATSFGQGIRFKEEEVRAMGRQAAGVRGIKLRDDDVVVGMEIISPENTKDLLFATAKGYGKRVRIEDFRIAHRGGVGVRTIPTDRRNGEVIGLVLVAPESNILLIDTNGKIIRLSPKEIRTMRRHAKGVRLIKLDSKQTLVTVVAFEEEEKEEEESIES